MLISIGKELTKKAKTLRSSPRNLQSTKLMSSTGRWLTACGENHPNTYPAPSIDWCHFLGAHFTSACLVSNLSSLSNCTLFPRQITLSDPNYVPQWADSPIYSRRRHDPDLANQSTKLPHHSSWLWKRHGPKPGQSVYCSSLTTATGSGKYPWPTQFSGPQFWNMVEPCFM